MPLKKESPPQEMEKITRQINRCQKCDLHKSRKHPIAGEGSLTTNIIFIGESPGKEEDIAGRPFVGKAGKILNSLLEIINLKRKNIYITNILKCHPPKNHNPTRLEINSCRGYLDHQLQIIKPKVIVTLGKYASREIFKRFNLPFTKISDLQGKTFSAKTPLGKIYILPFYHPALGCYSSKKLKILQQSFKYQKKILKTL